MLHIPAARSNLISGLQLDKAGVISTLGNNTIFLSTNNQIIVTGTVINDMYRLNLNIIRPNNSSLTSRIKHPSLESRIAMPSLASRIGPLPLASRITPIAHAVNTPADFYTA